MPVEFSDALIERLQDLLPGQKVTESQAAYSQGGPGPGMVTYSVAYPGGAVGNPRLIAVEIDINIFTAGPDMTAGDDIASAIEDGLLLWSVVTDRQGRVRLYDSQRAHVPAPDGKTAHVTMRLSGRGFRRLGNG